MLICPTCGKEFEVRPSRMKTAVFCSKKCYSKSRDLIGKRFGRLVVIKDTGQRIDGNMLWLCQCDCGNKAVVRGYCLRSGETKSCGCLRYENPHTRTHELSKSALYRCWQAIKRRCFNPNCKDYKDYGERGITICQEWRDDFVAFHDWAVKNGYQETLSIDRINVDGDYCPENCRWVDMRTQQNNRRNNHIVEYEGERHTLAEWCRILGVSKSLLYGRISKGWSVCKAFTTPPKGKEK